MLAVANRQSSKGEVPRRVIDVVVRRRSRAVADCVAHPRLRPLQTAALRATNIKLPGSASRHAISDLALQNDHSVCVRKTSMFFEVFGLTYHTAYHNQGV